MNNDCIFCKIVKGEIPAARVMETPEILAFMDINPVMKGHTLVIPKQHYDPITETPDPVLGHLMAAVRKIVRAQMQALGALGVNVTQANGALAGQCVPHIHFHVIPRCAGDAGVFNWTPGKYSSPGEMQTWADKIARHLTGH